MKKILVVVCAIIAIVMGAQFVNANSVKESVAAENVGYTSKYDKMFFSTRYVYDLFGCEAGDNCSKVHYVIYDDPDSEMYFEVIRLTEEAWNKIWDEMETGDEFRCYLKANYTYESIEHSIEPLNE